MTSVTAPARSPGADARAVAPRRALWVLCEGSRRVLEDPARIDALMADARALEATDLFVQVYRGGRAWYDASLADPAPYRAMVEAQGRDPLRVLIERAREAELRVHAWVNVLSLNRHADGLLVRELGPQSIHVDRQGRSLLDYPAGELPEPDVDWYRMGTPGLYLDPGAPGVADRLVAIFGELVERYPGLDGLHLDYIRHPGVLPFVPGSRFGVGVDFGYGEGSRLQFQRDTGLRPPTPGARLVENSAAWDAWRRDKVTELVARIGERVRAVSPSIVLSAAVISYADRAYLSLFQDWRRWLREGLVDLAVPMVYTRDDRLLRYQLESFVGGPDADRIWPGLGLWLFDDEPERALAQLAIARDVGLPGEALFSYDALVGSPALQAALAASPLPAITTAPAGADAP